MEQIFKILEEIRPEMDFCSSDDFITDGMLDSFDIVMIVAELEKEFNILIDGTKIIPENFSNIETIHKMVKESKKK